MDEAESVPEDQAILESSATNEEIPEAEEQKLNDGIEEESNKETNEPQESGITSQVAEEDAAPEQTSVKEVEEEPLIPNQEIDIPSGGGMSDTASLQKEPQESCQEPSKSKASIGQLSLRSGKSLPSQPTNESDNKGESSWISANTGKELQSRSIQTSLIWKRKPLVEILQSTASSWSVTHQVSEDAEKAMKEAKEMAPAGDIEMEAEQLFRSFHSSQSLGEEKPQGDSQPATIKESKLNPESEDQVSLYGSQPLTENQTRIPSLLQLTNEVRNEENTVWINPKTGKEMKCSFNQTSHIWERKPLAHILHPSGTEKENLGWGSGNGTAISFESPHVIYNPEAPEWAGYPNPFEY